MKLPCCHLLQAAVHYVLKFAKNIAMAVGFFCVGIRHIKCFLGYFALHQLIIFYYYGYSKGKPVFIDITVY